jgi:hypothetical protein
VISQWSAAKELDDELISIVQEKFVPGIKALGAERAFFVETGPDAIQVIVVYADEDTANRAREAQEKIRAQSGVEMPVTFQSEVRGRVFVSD